MYHVIIFTHGNLSHALQNTAKMIIGEIRNLSVYSVLEDSDLTSVENTMDKKIKKILKEDKKPLILTDLYFGTPFNIVINLMNKYKIDHITGVNLPMLIEVINFNNNENLEVNLNKVIEESKNGIQMIDQEEEEDEKRYSNSED